MSEYLQFEPNGLFSYRWDGDKQKDVRGRPKRSKILAKLRNRCEVKDGTTLGDVFRAVDRYPLLKTVISQYSWCPQIDEFHAQATEPMRSSDAPPLNYLEIYHDASLTTYKGHTEFDVSTGFHGIGPATADLAGMGAEPGEIISYSVSCCPAYDLADVPLRLNKSFKLYDEFRVERTPSTPRVIVEATREFTLLEVIDSIYWDISFHGGPADNAEFLVEMKDIVEKIKSGEIETVPMDDLIGDGDGES